MPRRGPASPAAALIGKRSPASGVPKPRLAPAAVRPERRPPPRPLAASPGACAARLTSLLLSRRRPGRPARAAGTMFRRKLTALDYHNPAGFNCKGGRRPRGPETAPPQSARTRTRRPGSRYPAAAPRHASRGWAARRAPAGAAGRGRGPGRPSGRAES